MSDAAVRWAGLLVSVRDALEAAEAVAGGAAIVDVKEPLNGALGAAPAVTAAAVAATIAGRVPWTLACGELGSGAAAMLASAAVAALPCGIPPPAAAKAGSAGLTIGAWTRAFAAFVTSLPPGVEPVAVAYADWRAAAAPDPRELVAAAAALGCRTLLVDTFEKNGPSVLDAAAAELPVWIGAARAVGMAVALAGRLSRADVPRAAGLGVDVCAVRTAACRGGRLGSVDRALVAATAAAWALAASRTTRGADRGTVRASTATLHAEAEVGRRSVRESHVP